MKRKDIDLDIRRLDVKQFAMLGFPDEEVVSLVENIHASSDYKNRLIVVTVSAEYSYKKQKCLVIEVANYYTINEKCWNEISKSNSIAVTLPKSFMSWLIEVSVNNTRGVLSAKTEHTKFDKFILPLIAPGAIKAKALAIKKSMQ
jgi:hypothetical protein